MQSYKGSCHCGDVQYEVMGEIANGVECNCSMCLRKGTVLAFIQAENFKLISGAGAMTNYQFNKKTLDHNFCQKCGVTPFVTGKSPEGKAMYAVNTRCLENFDIKSLNITQVDGRSF